MSGAVLRVVLAAIKAVEYDLTRRTFIENGKDNIPAPKVRAVVDEMVAKAGDRMQDLASRFTEGSLSEAEYVTSMRDLVKALHMGSTAIGRGGVAQVTKRDLSKLGPLLRDEYKALQRRVGQFEAGEASAAQVVATVRGYANKAAGTYENAKVDSAKAGGHTEIRRLLHANESCTAANGVPGCVEEHARGWHDISTFVRLGACVCSGNCRCSTETRIKEGD